MKGISACGFHLYGRELMIEVARSKLAGGSWAVRLRNEDCSIQLDVLLDDEQIDALRVAIGQAEQALEQAVVTTAE